MLFTIAGRKCTPSDNFKARAEKKMKKIERFFGPDATAKVLVTVEKKFQAVEITVNNNGYIYRAEERSTDMSEALDKCVDTLIRQIRKNKTRIEKQLRSGAFEDLLDVEPVVEEDYEVVRTKTIHVKPESVEEAILQMNMLDHMFYMFINADTDKVCVVYKRNDGGYGLLETDD